MSQQTRGPITATTSEAITHAQRIYLDTDGEWAVATAAIPATHIADGNAASGDPLTGVPIQSPGTFELIAAGVVAVGDRVYGAASGRAGTTPTGADAWIARRAATGAGARFEAALDTAAEPGAEFVALGRAAAALPTAALWENFPRSSWLVNHDFREGAGVPAQTLVDADSRAHLQRGTSGVGELNLFTTTDNEAAEAVFQAPVPVTGSGAWLLEFVVTTDVIADTKAGFAVGLMAADRPTGDLIADAGTLADVGFVGVQRKEGDGDILDVVYDKASQTQNEHDDDWHTLAAGTAVKVAMHYDGSTITLYKNGVASGDPIAAADIAAADFPAAVVMNPAFIQKSAAADDVNTKLDWIRFAHLPA